MNATMRAQRAYSTGAIPIRSAKSAEYDAIARVTHQLKVAATRKDTHFPELVQALETNRKLWSIFAIDVAGSGNQLPASLRASIFSLAEFTFAHTRRILARQEEVDDLIEINTAIMRGLNPGGD